MFHVWHTEERPRMEKFGSFFSKMLLKLYFKISTHRYTQTGHIFSKSGHFFAKSGHFFSFFKKGQGRPPPPLPPFTPPEFVCVLWEVFQNTSSIVHLWETAYFMYKLQYLNQQIQWKTISRVLIRHFIQEQEGLHLLKILENYPWRG